MSEVNYNDGNWYGWNGGECPVHPETEIQGMYIDPETNTIAALSPVCDEAKHFDWNRVDNYILIAFRVIKEYKEPREFWLLNGTAHTCHRGAIVAKSRAVVEDCGPILEPKIIHVREVLE